jgi:hypothetical protein
MVSVHQRYVGTIHQPGGRNGMPQKNEEIAVQGR